MVVITLLTGLFLIFFPSLYHTPSGLFGGEKMICYTSILFCLLLLFGIAVSLRKSIKKREKKRLPLTFIDLSILGYLAYGLLNITIINDLQIDGSVILKWQTALLGYILIRFLPNKRVILFALPLSGVFQSIISIGQWLELWENSYSTFDITGHFGNPGQLGGYLAVCFTISTHLFFKVIKNKSWWISTLFIITITLLTIGLFLSDSRAGLLGALLGVALLFPISTLFHNPTLKFISIISIVFVFTFASIILYQYRPKSANARLLIWRVSTSMIAKKPILGHGVTSFKKEYMLYQAEYFENNPDSKFAKVADDVIYPYNEAIHVVVETGFIGLFLSIFIFLSALISPRDHINTAFKAGLLTLLTFSMFSYPISIFPLFLLFAILLGGIKGKVIAKFRANQLWYLSISTILLLVLPIVYKQKKFYDTISIEMNTIYNTIFCLPTPFISHNYEKLKNHPHFNKVYHEWIARNSTEWKDIEIIKNLFPSCESYCQIGDYYHRIGLCEEAEYLFIKASNMIPTRIRPNYNLWKIYIETKNHQKALEISEKILSQPLKVENSYTIRVKTEIRKYMATFQ